MNKEKEDIRAGKSTAMLKEEKRPAIGIALGSGIARGFAHIGALKALDRHGIRPSVVAGTSIGALVGGSYLAGKLDEFEEWALSLNRRRILSFMDFKVGQPGLIGGRRFIKLLNQNFGDLQIEDFPVPFVAISSELSTGHEVWIREGRLVDAMTASFALPGIFPPVEFNGRRMIDGALVNPVPVSPCQALGARLTIAIDLNADLIGKVSKPGHDYQTVAGFDILDEKDSSSRIKSQSKKKLLTKVFSREKDKPSLFGVMVSSLNIVQDRLTRSRLAGEPPDVHIKPRIGHIGLMELERAEEMIAAGEAAVEESIPDIKAAMEVLLIRN